ncbi:hypothetical protein Bbelb_287960 [Branchiostoma belcheri]|nr:hypothetical protein Bbelb_287960 [Branchiostoma belcheri]
MAEAMEKAVEGVNLHIPGRCQEDDARDDAAKNGSDTGGDSFIQQSADFDVCTQLYERRWIQVLVVVVTVWTIVSLIVGGIFAVKASMGGPQLKPRDKPTWVSLQIQIQKSTEEDQSDWSKALEIAGRKLEKITIGTCKEGNKPGEFKSNYGVAVSADNEIFVTDYFNKRVQVFSIDGTYLRLFPTVVPGESSRMPMYPSSVASDVNPEYLWVLGFPTPVQVNGHVVLYSRNGRPIKKFDVRFLDRNRVQYPVIAMDTRNNKVIVMDRDTIRLFHPNGTIYRSILYRSINTKATITMGVTSDREGNILLNDGFKTILVYNPSGEKIFQFGTFGRNMGQLNIPIGICMGTSGRIIVANSGNNRVDMFGRSGEFVRTIGNVIKPWGIAIGPDGDVVVTSPRCRGGPDVSIFPGHMVFL